MKYARFDECGILLARYDSAVHGAMPKSGYVALSDDVFYRSIAEAEGVWQLQADGGVEKKALPPITRTAEQLAADERAWRDEQIFATEWVVSRQRDQQDMQLATTLKIKQFAEMLQYRQALRDWPQSELFPVSEHRPVPPPWLESMTP
jgi:hypothetical protein